jgi:hypothetical protein
MTIEHSDTTTTTATLPVASRDEFEGSGLPTLLQQPNVLGRLVTDIQAAGVVGEEISIRLVSLVAVSRLLDDPLGLVIKSAAGTGKSYVPKKVVSYFPENAVETMTGITAHALDSSGERLRHKLVLLDEAPGMDDAAPQLRMLFSNKRLVTNDPRGDRIAEGPIAFITTTTQHSTEAELESRLLTISMDESSEATRAIVEAACIAAGQTGSTRIAGLEEQRLRWRAALGMLRPAEVCIPGLRERLGEDFAGRHSARRDIGKLIGLIRAHALLNQYQRAEVDGALQATNEDVDAALSLMGPHLNHLPDRFRTLADALGRHFACRNFTVTQAAAALGRSGAIHRDLKQLVELGLLEKLGKSRGKVAGRWQLTTARPASKAGSCGGLTTLRVSGPEDGSPEAMVAASFASSTAAAA